MISATKPVAAPKVAAGPKRAIAVNAQADRRAILGGFVAGVASLVAEKASAEATNVDLFDDRSARKRGFDIIYEARDLDLPQAERDGISQFRGDLTATKARLSESSRRINEVLPGFIDKSYWTPAKEELRNQLGNMRQDLNTLAAAKQTKAERKEAAAKVKAFFVQTEVLDFAIRSKDLEKAQKEYATTKGLLADVRSFVQA